MIDTPRTAAATAGLLWVALAIGGCTSNEAVAPANPTRKPGPEAFKKSTTAGEADSTPGASSQPPPPPPVTP